MLAARGKEANSFPAASSQKAANLPTFRQLQLIEEDLENSYRQHKSSSGGNANSQTALPVGQTSSKAQTAVPQQWLSPPRQASFQAAVPHEQTNSQSVIPQRQTDTGNFGGQSKETLPVQKEQRVLPSHTTSPLTWTSYQKDAPSNRASCETGYAQVHSLYNVHHYCYFCFLY